MISIKELIRNEVDRRRQNLVYELMGREEDCAYHRIKGNRDKKLIQAWKIKNK